MSSPMPLPAPAMKTTNGEGRVAFLGSVEGVSLVCTGFVKVRPQCVGTFWTLDVVSAR